MKNWLYIPFLVLMAVTYTRLHENSDYLTGETTTNSLRAPASVEASTVEVCLDLPGQFNPHYNSNNCPKL